MQLFCTRVSVLFFLLNLVAGFTTHAQQILYKNQKFTVTHESVKQDKYTAKAKSRTHIISDYQAQTDQIGRTIHFKFSINGLDNEQAVGATHTLTLPKQERQFISPLYVFGKPDSTAAAAQSQPNDLLSESVSVTFRLDMRPVFEAFSKEGYYRLYNGEKIVAGDFKGIFIAGDIPPLTWNFTGLADQTPFRLSDPDRDGIYELTISFNNEQLAADGRPAIQEWQLSEDISVFPQYESNHVLVDALYNLSLEEILKNIRSDSAFMAGAQRGGIWTRDISYSLFLSLAAIAPEHAKVSLMKKVKDGLIIQDTGTGGSWPVSSDRVTWALAAWEVYAVTGDKEWLQKAYEIIRHTIEADELTVYDGTKDLFRGESSFLDWREQSYPSWMDPKDIYTSLCLGTNAVYYQTYRILAKMAEALGSPNPTYNLMADVIKTSINKHLWQPDLQYYGQYLYGRVYPVVSPRAETLGESLSILFDIADQNQKASIIQRLPVTDYGTPSFFPQIPDVPSYHNNAIWPFVEAYRTWAAARTNNSRAVEHGLAAIHRQAALFLTNKENLVASSGSYVGTETNSDRQLWSAAGHLATIYRVLFGIQFDSQKITFRPFVPAAYRGTKTLHNLRYRDANLTIVLQGYGNNVRSVTLDGRSISSAELSSNLSGNHRLVITLANNSLPTRAIQLVQNQYAPKTPSTQVVDGILRWEDIPGAKQYSIYRNGKKLTEATKPSFPLPTDTVYTEYQVLAIGENGLESFLSEPMVNIPDAQVLISQVETTTFEKQHEGYTGKGYQRIGSKHNLILPATIQVPAAGTYVVDFRYSNGNGPVNTDNKCAVRTLSINNTDIGTIVFPQRGQDNWTDWGFTNSVSVELPAGLHTFLLIFRRNNTNMDGQINEAIIDYIRLRKLE